MLHDLLQFVRESWQNRPAMVVLSVVGFVVLLFLLVDTHRHRRRRKKLRQGRQEH